MCTSRKHVRMQKNVRTRVFDLFAPMGAPSFMIFFVVVNSYHINLSLKFHKDQSFGNGDISKIKLTFCNH